jgi:hypothetical protein
MGLKPAFFWQRGGHDKELPACRHPPFQKG